MPPFHPDTRRTGIDPFDERYGGLIPGEVVIVAGDALDQVRSLALDIAAQATRVDAERRQRAGQVWWYRAGASWSSSRYGKELCARAGEGAERVSFTGVGRAGVVHADDLERQARAWADYADTPALVVVDALEDVVGRWVTRVRALKTMALRQPHVPVVVLAYWPNAGGPRVSDYADVGDAADFLLWTAAPVSQLSLLRPAEDVELDVRKARSGFPPARLTIPRPRVEAAGEDNVGKPTS